MTKEPALVSKSALNVSGAFSLTVPGFSKADLFPESCAKTIGEMAVAANRNSQKILVLFGSFLIKRSIEKIIGKRNTLQFKQLRVGFHVFIQRHTELPWARKSFRVVDCRFVAQVKRRYRRIPLRNMCLLAIEIARAVHPDF